MKTPKFNDVTYLCGATFRWLVRLINSSSFLAISSCSSVVASSRSLLLLCVSCLSDSSAVACVELVTSSLCSGVLGGTEIKQSNTIKLSKYESGSRNYFITTSITLILSFHMPNIIIQNHFQHMFCVSVSHSSHKFIQISHPVHWITLLCLKNSQNEQTSIVVFMQLTALTWSGWKGTE